MGMSKEWQPTAQCPNGITKISPSAVLVGVILFNTLVSDTESTSLASSQMPLSVVQQEGMPSRGILTG